MRVAIYCRVDGGGSLEMRRAALDMQRCELEHYAVEKGFQISGYYEDNGFSGHDLSRPGLTQLRIDYDSGSFERVLVVNRNRLYRGNLWSEPHWPFPIYSLKQ